MMTKEIKETLLEIKRAQEECKRNKISILQKQLALQKRKDCDINVGKSLLETKKIIITFVRCIYQKKKLYTIYFKAEKIFSS